MNWKHEQNTTHPVDIYLLKVNNANTRTTCEIYPKLTMKAPERHGVVLVSLLLTLDILHVLFHCSYC